MALLSLRAVAAAAALTLVGAGSARAADEDLQAWWVVQANGALSDRVVMAMDTQARMNEDASRLGQLLIRPSIGWKLDATRTASLGYAYVRTSSLGRAATHEHRVWQQLTFRVLGDGKGPTLTGRTRLEQRWVEGADGTGWRLRQQIRFTAPLSGRVRAVATTEPFIGLNQTEWGQRDGVQLWRSFVGVSAPLSKSVTIEPGYLHQHAFRRGEDAVTHAASVSLNLQF